MGLIKFIRDVGAKRKARQEEVARELAVFQERLRHALLRRNRHERDIFTYELKQQIWEPDKLLILSSQAKENPEAFLKAQCTFAKKHNVKTFR